MLYNMLTFKIIFHHVTLAVLKSGMTQELEIACNSLAFPQLLMLSPKFSFYYYKIYRRKQYRNPVFKSPNCHLDEFIMKFKNYFGKILFKYLIPSSFERAACLYGCVWCRWWRWQVEGAEGCFSYSSFFL